MPAGAVTLLRFAATGLVNTAIGFAVILLALHLGAGDLPANASGYGVGLTIGFLLNRRWTFEVTGRTDAAEVARYLGAFALAWSCNLAVVIGGVQLGHGGAPLLHLAGIGVYSIVFFALSRQFVFARGRATETLAWRRR